jgi:exopolysaccharide biosynthesis polyprenyl glycosylphosphotransferase
MADTLTLKPAAATHPAVAVPVTTRGSKDGSRERSLPSRPIPGARLLFLLELALPAITLVSVLVISNVQAMPDGLDSFLSMRVTLKNVLLFALFEGAWGTIFALCGLYQRATLRRTRSEMPRVVMATSLGTLVAAVFPLTTVSGVIAARHLVYFWLVITTVELAIRMVRRAVAEWDRDRSARRALIIGSGPRALDAYIRLQNDDSATYEVVGFVDDPSSLGSSERVIPHTIGTLDDLENLLMQETVDDIFIALPVKSRYMDIQCAIQIAERVGVRTRYQADMFSSSVAWARADDAGTITMNVVPDDIRLTVKRVVDVLGATVGMILLSPVMVSAAMAIKLTSRGPIFFTQERCGLNKRTFRMLKFRTMVSDAEALQASLEHRNEAEGPVFKILDDPRITPVGRFLRRTSIDELPQLVNVLLGDMSLVGPRPLPLRDLRRFTSAADLRRFSFRPGITCLWQINGRSKIGFSEWVRLDLEYIDGWSLLQDLKILIKTIPAVLRGTGAA